MLGLAVLNVRLHRQPRALPLPHVRPGLQHSFRDERRPRLRQAETRAQDMVMQARRDRNKEYARACMTEMQTRAADVDERDAHIKRLAVQYRRKIIARSVEWRVKAKEIEQEELRKIKNKPGLGIWMWRIPENSVKKTTHPVRRGSQDDVTYLK